MIICAIHQPNFFPWLGFFNKIARCDKFVVGDDFQLVKKGSSWSNRVKIQLHGKEAWLTAPVLRVSGLQNLNEAEYINETDWRRNIENILVNYYRKSRFFKEAMQILEPMIFFSDNKLTAYNINALKSLSSILDIDFSTKIVFSSDIIATSTSTLRLVELIKAVGCDTYLAGGGASGYQEDQLFEEQGIQLIYQSFQHPHYSQAGLKMFLPGMSIIDVLMNCSVDEAKKLVRGKPLE